MQWNGDRVTREVEQIGNRRLVAAAVYLAGKVKENLSVPAPRRLVKSPRGHYYRATTPATPGAFPRKLSGKLRRDVTYQIVRPGVVRIGVITIYARRLGATGHEFMLRTLKAEQGPIERILRAA